MERAGGCAGLSDGVVGRAGGVGGPRRPRSKGARGGTGRAQEGGGAIFFGAEPVAFDAKKTRLSVPSAFRTVLTQMNEPDLVLRPSNHSPCIDVWPKGVFQTEVDRRIKDLDPFSEEFDAVTDGLTVKAFDARVDSDGRIVLPKALLADVPLDPNAVIVGRRSFFQIWSAPVWAARQGRPSPRSPSAEAPPA